MHEKKKKLTQCEECANQTCVQKTRRRISSRKAPYIIIRAFLAFREKKEKEILAPSFFACEEEQKAFNALCLSPSLRVGQKLFFVLLNTQHFCMGDIRSVVDSFFSCSKRKAKKDYSQKFNLSLSLSFFFFFSRHLLRPPSGGGPPASHRVLPHPDLPALYAAGRAVVGGVLAKQGGDVGQGGIRYEDKI